MILLTTHSSIAKKDLLNLGVPRISWCPLFDQSAQSELETNNQIYFGNPDFSPGQTFLQTRDKIHRALLSAHEKGVRTLDIQYIVTTALIQEDYAINYIAPPYPPRYDKTLPGMAHSNEIWLQEVERFNKSHVEDPFQLKLRLQATAASIYYVFRTLKPYQTFLKKETFREGITRSQFPDLPYDPCFEKVLSSDSCFVTSPIPGNYYRSRLENGNLNNAVANLANSAIRKAIVEWTRIVIREALMNTSPSTVIKEVSLALDAGSESSLFPSDTASVVSFSNATYSPSMGISEKMIFFQEREAYLKMTYKAFAEAVHKCRNRNGSAINAGIFQQAWAIDGRSRGTFDLYSLLKGTGIDVLHHTQQPMDSTHSLMTIAFSAGIASALNIDFGTEFSWAHFGGEQPLFWNRKKLSETNAKTFFQQAHAGWNYGVTEFTYANWTMNEFISPPGGYEWERIVGSSDPNKVKNKIGNLIQGLIEESLEKSPPNRALYISTVGRMECEEKRAHPDLQGNPCDLESYFDWFRKFGLWIGKENGSILEGRFIVLTDGMIQDRKPDPYSILQILMPFETSAKIDRATFRAIEKLPSNIKDRFQWQNVAGSLKFVGLKDWEAKVQIIPFKGQTY